MFHTFSPPFLFPAPHPSWGQFTIRPPFIRIPSVWAGAPTARLHAPLNRASSLLSGQASPTDRPRPRPSAFRFTPRSVIQSAPNQFAVFVIQSASEESGNLRQPFRFFSNRTPSVGGDSRIARLHAPLNRASSPKNATIFHLFVYNAPQEVK